MALDHSAPRLSVLIKALNEEGRIAACLESVLIATQDIDTEIILADSLSSDGTVEIASRFPVTIVQFENLADRGCGAAVQLAYQIAKGEYLYVLDADMQMEPGFLSLALPRMEAEPSLAGISGLLKDVRILTEADRRRLDAMKAQTTDQYVAELGGGGLYRSAAVQQAGYLANRWLAAYEEADLGARLNSLGWRLLRLNTVAVHHEGHAEGNFALLRRQWRNGRLQAGGVFLRFAIGRPWWRRAFRKQAYLFTVPFLHIAPIATASIGGILTSSIVIGAWMWILAWVAQWLLIALAKRSFFKSTWIVVGWHYAAIAAFLGFIRPLSDPLDPIQSRIICEPKNH